MDARYLRNIPALTEAECTLLRTKKVLVVGCGGLGGHIIDQLLRIGVGSIRAVDGDTFDASNLNRQLLSDMSKLGTAKAQAAAHWAAAVNPDVALEAVETFLTVENARELVSGCDIVMDALDNIGSRKVLAAACEAENTPYVYGAIQGWVAQAAISLPGDKLIETLYPEGISIGDKSVLSFTPAMCASLQVSLCIKYLTGHPVINKQIYYMDLLNQEFEIIPMG